MTGSSAVPGSVPPSGRQVEIVHGEQRATVVEVGGGIRSYTFAGDDVLDGYGIDDMCAGGRGQVLMPWPNRIADGAYEFDGRRFQLPLTEPTERNAIHGLVRWADWEVAELDGDRVVMAHRSFPQPGYPFLLDLRIEYRLSDGGLHVQTTARNVGPMPCPFGAGAHPYLTVGTARIDDASLLVEAGSVLEADERGIPRGRSTVARTALDLATGRDIGDLRLDHAFTELVRAADGRAWARLSAPSGGREARLWVDESYPFLMLFTGDTLPDGGRRSLAVEPMTCAPNAFVSGDGLIILEPGETFSGSWGIAPA